MWKGFHRAHLEVITWPTAVWKWLYEKGNDSADTLLMSGEQNTSVRIAVDSPLLSWLPRFAAQVMDTMRNGKDGKTTELRRTGRR